MERNEESKPDKTVRAKWPQVWGRRSHEFYVELEGQMVHVATVSGKSFKGVLIGVDVYDLIVRQDTGLELLINKGSVLYVHRAVS